MLLLYVVGEIVFLMSEDMYEFSLWLPHCHLVSNKSIGHM